MATEKNRNEVPFRIPVSCLADFMSSSGRSAESLLRPYKFNKRGEGFARSSYYQYAVTAIRDHHTNGNDPKVFPAAILELRKKTDATDKNWQRVKLEKNISAIEAYQRVYKDRNFRILPNHRIGYRIGRVIFTAQPEALGRGERHGGVDKNWDCKEETRLCRYPSDGHPQGSRQQRLSAHPCKGCCVSKRFNWERDDLHQ